MSNKLAYFTGGVLTAVLSVSPAFAELTVPEPATISLLGAGALAAVAISRFRRRK